MSSRFKLTAMELAALSVLTLAVAAIAVTLSVRSCNDSVRQPVTAATDSVTTAIENRLASPDSLTEVIKPRSKKTKKAKKSKAPRKSPKQRNYLDEPVNE